MNKKLITFLTAIVFFLTTGSFTLMAQAEAAAAEAATGPLFEDGRGRADMTLAVLRPEGQNLLPTDEKYLSIIQGALIAEFSRFSAIQLTDPMHLHNLLEEQRVEQIKQEQQRLIQQQRQAAAAAAAAAGAAPVEGEESAAEANEAAASEAEAIDPEAAYAEVDPAEAHYAETHYSETGYANIGELANTKYVLKGTLRKTGTLYSLSLSFLEAATSRSLGEYHRDSININDLGNSRAARSAISELLVLPEVGVLLTAAGEAALKQLPNTDELEAQTALALSYEASINGYLIESLIYSYIASAADKNLAAAKVQAANTFKLMSGAGTAIKEDIKQQAEWKKYLSGFEGFYQTHTPFELYYTEVPVQRGFIDFEKGTVDWEFTVGLRQKGGKTMQKVLNDILKELKKTNAKKNHWGFDNWPRVSADSTSLNQKRTEAFEGFKTFSIKAALMNSEGEVVSTIEFPLYGQVLLKGKSSIKTFATQERKMVFTVDGSLTTEDMRIRIVSINDMEVDKANVDIYLKNAVVEKMPIRIAGTISQKELLVPVLPEDREKQMETIAKRREAESFWASKALEKRKNVNAAAVFNPQNGKDALSVEAGIGWGYRNLSIDGRLIYPIAPMTDDFAGLTYGIGLTTGFTFVQDYYIWGFNAGGTYYIDTTNKTNGLVPVVEAKFDFITSGKTGIAFRGAYKMEFGNPDANDFFKGYFGPKNSFGGDSFRMVGSPTAGIVIWFN